MVIETEPRFVDVTAGDFARCMCIMASVENRLTSISEDARRAIDEFEPSCAADGTWHMGSFSLKAASPELALFSWDPGFGCDERTVLVKAMPLD